MSLTKDVYQATRSFPIEERFGLITQMRRSAVSIPSNLAEGHTRAEVNEFRRFISIALGSVAELETQITLSSELEFLNEQAAGDLLKQIDIIGKMLRGLYKALGAKS